MAIVKYRTTPYTDPRRLKCGHLRNSVRRHPWCIVCVRVLRGMTHWRKNRKGKIRYRHEKGWGFGVASRRRKKVRTNTQVARARARSQESRQIRNLLFREGQGRSSKLSPASRLLVRQYFHSRYDEYCTRMKFADRPTMTYYLWRRKAYGSLKSSYGRDVAKAVKLESNGGELPHLP